MSKLQRLYKAGLVGCGGIGRSHARALATLPGVELLATLADKTYRLSNPLARRLA